MKIIRLTDTHVIITEGNIIEKIPIDEENPLYQQVKAETDNFTRNMVQKSPLEILQETIDQLVIDLLEGV